MVNQRGQTVTEYILMLAILTLIGGWIMKAMVNSDMTGKSGAIHNMSETTAEKIAADNP